MWGIVVYCLVIFHPDTRNITLEMVEGQGLNITCRTIIEGNPVVWWMKDNIPVNSGRSKFLFLESINRTQAGNYVCVSVNRNGNRTSSITTVNVLCKFITVGKKHDYLEVLKLQYWKSSFADASLLPFEVTQYADVQHLNWRLKGQHSWTYNCWLNVVLNLNSAITPQVQIYHWDLL